MAKIIAEGLNGEMNAVLIHKIPAPHQPELAIGSVGLSGEIFRLPEMADYGFSETYIQQEAARQLEVLKNRKRQFQLPELDCRNRTVIIVDDGIATGATAIGAIHEIRAQRPRKLILAAGVVARSTALGLRRLVDEFVVLDEPEMFFAVSEFYREFAQVTDEEVVQIISDLRKIESPKIPKEQPRPF